MYQRILTIQDISCIGQCSLTVALPILSACGLETVVLPSAVLSSHTAGFTGYTFRDLTEDMPAIEAHWNKEGIRFSAIYTGYLGSSRQVDYVRSIFRSTAAPGCIKIVDPAMADNGRLYPGFDEAFVEAMKQLCADADYIVPNLTESCFLTGTPYPASYDRGFIDALLEKLMGLGCKNIILTGIAYAPGRSGVVVCENGLYSYYEHEKLPNSCHGTGDIYASAFTGALVQGHNAYESAGIAAEFTLECIRQTAQYPDHWYGAAFEPALPRLMQLL